MERARRIRWRALVEDRFGVLVGVCLVLAAVGGAVAYSAHLTENTTTRTEPVATWESSGEFTHRATVIEDTEVYSAGQVLRERTTYFRALTPTLNGTFAYRYEASDGGDLTATATVVLVLQSTEQREGETVRYWRVESELGEPRTRSARPGEVVRVPFSLNTTAVRSRLDRIDRQIGGTPGETESILEVRLDLEGTRNGRSVDERRSYRLPVAVGGSVYRVEDPGPITDSGEQERTVTVPDPPGPVRAVGGPVAAGLGLLGAGALFVGRSRGVFRTTERERDLLAFRGARQEFDDWVTVANLREIDPDSVVKVESLEGLVDVAVDTDGRVLQDRSSDVFVVFDGAKSYVFSPPTGPELDGDLLVRGRTAAPTDAEAGGRIDPTRDDGDAATGTNPGDEGATGAAGGSSREEADGRGRDGPGDAADPETDDGDRTGAGAGDEDENGVFGGLFESAGSDDETEADEKGDAVDTPDPESE